MFMSTKQHAIARPLANVYVQTVLIAVILTASTYALALALGWIAEGTLNWFEIAAGVLNYGATFLCIKQKRSYALIGIVGSATWAYVFWSNDLLASAIVNAYLALTLIYGYWRWGQDKNPRPVHHLAWKWVPAYAAVTGVIYLGAVWLTTFFGGSFAFWDAAILVLTILAQLLQDQKVITVWLIWTLVNIVGVVLYFNTELYFAMIQQVIFGFANIWGWIEWKKTMTQETLV